MVVLIAFIFVHLRVGENWIDWTENHKAAVARVLEGTATPQDWSSLCDDRDTAEMALQTMQ